jgi:autotransporter-associated beta strand protein
LGNIELTVVSFSVNGGTGSYGITSAELSSRLAATLDGDLSGAGGLTFAGPGTLTLTGVNTYAGTTQVTGGALIVNGTIGSTRNPTTVGSGAFLGGTGAIVNMLQILSGGTVSPGTAAGTGILTVGGLNFQDSQSTALMQITGATAGTGYDQIVSTGNLDYTGGRLQLQMSGTYADNTVFDLFSAGSVSGTLAAISMVGSGGGWESVTWYTPGATGAGLYDYGEGVWQSSWTTVGGDSRKLIFNQVSGNLMVVPEPSTFAMAGAGVVAAAIMRWRRRRRGNAAREEAATPSAA